MDAAMHVANKDQIRVAGSEVGRISYVPVTAARNLLVLAVPENCLGEFEPELIECGIKKNRHLRR